MINSTYKYLLSDLKSLKGVGLKTSNLLKKKKLIIFLIYYGNYQDPILIEVYLQRLKISRLVKFKQLL